MVVVVAYGQILPRDVLEIPRVACLNLHASLLPRWRGAAPVQAAIAAGDCETGITVMYMDEGLDTGDILLQRNVEILPNDTGGSLHDRLAQIAPETLLESLRLLAAGNAPRIPQDNARATYAPKLKREHGQIDWSESAEAIERKIRAYNPWPGAFMKVDRQNLKVFSASVVDLNGQPGEILRSDKDLIVATGKGALSLAEVQLEGKRRMSAAEFLRGHGALIRERINSGAERFRWVGRVTPCAPRIVMDGVQRTARPTDWDGLSIPRILLSKRGYLLFGCSSAAMEPEAPVYERIVLKLSGEAVQERGGRDNISPTVVRAIAERMKEVRDLGVEVAVVIGGGNIWRGLSAADRGMDRTTADYMGMLATVINALALRSTLEQIGVEARVQTAIEMKNVAEPFILGRAVRHLELGRVVIFAAGTGNPYFSTDTTAALRASEIRADVILKATKVDGVYDRDPNKFPDARRYDRLTFTEALTKRLQIMDSTAFSLCMDNKIPIVVFNMYKPGILRDAVLGRNVGTLVCDEAPPK